MSKIALIAGSFDPVSLGHEDLIARAANLFDTVYVTVFVNSDKTPRFSLAQRQRLLAVACAPYENVIPDASDCLLADYAREKGISVIVKGLRSGTDLDYELPMVQVNRTLCPGLDTLFLPTRPEFSHISSTIIREMLRYHLPLTGLVSKEVEKELALL